MSTENDKKDGIERRQYQRIPFHAEILMQSGNEEWTCNLLDISLNGMLVEPPHDMNINPNNPCAVALFLSDDVIINIRVRIRHTAADRWGLEFINIDVESLQHLRHLLESHLQDNDLINRELAQLG
ncbi:MAG: PilZ domain-containing protein [Gammaproteobacteria bacterium]|nr:PilZ domain-containing protein [Gammaproteobacteria bacterium]